MPGREQLVPQTISFLLMRSLQPDAKIADVKRVHSFRTALEVSERMWG